MILHQINAPNPTLIIFPGFSVSKELQAGVFYKMKLTEYIFLVFIFQAAAALYFP